VSINFLLDPRLRLVRTSYVGLVSLVELMAYARSLVSQGLLGRAQLIDCRSAKLALTASETRRFSEMMGELRADHGTAPVAFVAGDAASYDVARQYRELGAGSNPAFEVFADIAAAETWIAISSA
jgi:hypothetical protein